MFVRIGAVILLQSAVVTAGPLTPPPGPIAATMKTLSDVEPRTAINSVNTPGDSDSLFRITQPGSYYLTENITGVAGKHGIEIAASGVTLDLSGFDLVGVPGMGAFDGVSTTVSALTNITVRNGSVRGWGEDGVDLLSFAAIGASINQVRASKNAASGIRGASGGIITGCTVYDNVSHGIFAGSGSVVNECAAFFNEGNGFNCFSGVTVHHCTARSNSLNGIAVSNECVVFANTCSSNGDGSGDGSGIYVTGSDNRIESNNCTRADRGIDVDGSGNFIVRNTCSGNTINWAISANNVFGPIVDRRSPNTTAFFGDSAASSLGTTDANANFTY